MINGVKSPPRPFFVRVGLNEKDTLFCGGTVIHTSYVITAAHCLAPEKASAVSVHVGNFSQENSNSTRITVSNFTVHEKFKYGSKGKDRAFDIGIIKLSQPVGQSQIIGLCSHRTFMSRTIGACGMDTTSISGHNHPPKQLEEITMREKRGEDCSVKGWDREVQICLQDPEGLQRSCFGDSGGPVYPLDDNGDPICLYGIHSFGRGGQFCYSQGQIETRVSAYADWIAEQMEQMR
ncbi:brachyurin-like [Convolutriloba macropyga]|uniref:brachyurin-like n=1 Tax=Convolutriloba macropyga TaxID=536237 RepID=UPI003F5243BF